MSQSGIRGFRLWDMARFDPGTAMLVAGGVQAAGSIMGGMSQQQGDNYNATSAVMTGAADMDAAKARADQVQAETAQRIGQAQADFGASGVNGASPLSVLSSIASQGELQRQITLWQGKTQQIQQNNQANLDKWQGQQAMISGVMGAFGAGGNSFYKSTMLSPSSSLNTAYSP